MNEHFAGEFSDGDRVIVESIFQMFVNDKDAQKFKRLANENPIEMFMQSLFPDKFKDIATQCWVENSEAYQKLFNNAEFYQVVMESLARELYRSWNKKS